MNKDEIKSAFKDKIDWKFYNQIRYLCTAYEDTMPRYEIHTSILYDRYILVEDDEFRNNLFEPHNHMNDTYKMSYVVNINLAEPYKEEFNAEILKIFNDIHIKLKEKYDFIIDTKFRKVTFYSVTVK